MKKSLLISILTALVVMPAVATELTTESTTDTKYLKNHGHSDTLIQNIQKSKAQIAGEPLSEPVEKEYYNLPGIKQVRRFWMYLDPAIDDHSFMNDHNIKTSPSYEDL